MDNYQDATMVQISSSDINENFPDVKNVEYFNDGCAGQYKNYKNMHNLCLHQNDFKLEASWCFFATSHEKTLCDGIGGIVRDSYL